MKKYDVITSGYVSLDRIINVMSPLQVGFTSIISNKDNAKIHYGGCSLNIAYALAKLGLNTVPCIRVGGRDYLEVGIMDFLKEANVCVDAIEVVPDESTSNCYLLEDVEGNHITVFYPGAMDIKYAKPFANQFFEQAKLGVITVGSFKDNGYFFEQCKENNVPLVFGMKADFDAFPKGFLKELLLYSKIIFVNQSERECIENLYHLSSITDLFTVGNAEIIVVTLGKRGSICYEKTNAGIKATELRVAKCNVVDTTGSGDAYISGFLYGYLKGCNPVECCNLGAVLASFIVEAVGCCTNAPVEQQLLERYEEFIN